MRRFKWKFDSQCGPLGFYVTAMTPWFGLYLWAGYAVFDIVRYCYLDGFGVQLYVPFRTFTWENSKATSYFKERR